MNDQNFTKWFWVAFIAIMSTFTSCEQDEEFTNQLEDKSSEKIDEKKFKWNEVYRYNFTSKDVIPMDIPDFQTVSGTKASTIQVGEEKIYPSQNIVLSQFLQTGRWNEVFCKKSPHHLIFNFYPVPYIEEIKNPQDHLTYSMALANAMQSNEWEISSQSQTVGSAEASFVDVKTYSEFVRSFGANLSVGKFFSSNMSYDKNSKKYKTVFIARFKAANFDILTHVDNKITNERPVWDSQSYVSSLTFGKVAYLVIYSNYSYDKVKESINATFSAGLVSGGGNYSQETLNILQSSESYAWINGNNVTDTFYGNSPAFLEKLFQPIYNKTTIGTPVFFQLNKTSNNQLVDIESDNDGWIETPIQYITLSK